jgi:hypothetical protein
VGLFRRGGKDAADDAVEPEVEVEETPEVDERSRTTGPFDVDDVDDDLPRVDLGAIRVPGVQGMELRMEVDKATNTISAASVLFDGSSLQIQAFAAPRTEGIWDEIRAEIAQSVTQQGGSVDDLPGPFGRELLARLPTRSPEGRTSHRPARFIGADGPRWFLRGVITGRAAVEPPAAELLERVFGATVVVRGNDARPPRDLLALRLPNQGGPDGPVAPAEPEVPDFDPLTRGPEITEIR